MALVLRSQAITLHDMSVCQACDVLTHPGVIVAVISGNQTQGFEIIL